MTKMQLKHYVLDLADMHREFKEAGCDFLADIIEVTVDEILFETELN